MNCLECKDLDRAFQSRLAKYIEARTAAFYRVSTELAAKKNVDMERAKTDLQEHQSACRYRQGEALRPSMARRGPTLLRWSRAARIPG